MNAPSAIAAAPEARALAACDRLLGLHLRAAEERFGAAALGLLDLPPLSEEEIDADQIRAAATLYWASKVDQAGLLPVVEALAERFVAGELIEPIGRGGHLLFRFWRDRHERFSAAERRALYARVFGGDGVDGANREFEPLFEQLVNALDAFGRSPTTEDPGHRVARIGALAADVGRNLTPRTAGVVAFAARDVVSSCRTAFTVLRDPEVRAVLGGGSVWAIVQRLGARLLGKQLDPEPVLARGVAGMRILSWIADSAHQLPAVQLSRADEVVRAAETYVAESPAPAIAASQSG